MMKNLRPWQKAGLIAMIVGGLTLGGLTVKNSGLEGKIPSIGMSTAEAKTTNPDGYEVPDLKNSSYDRSVNEDLTDRMPGKETKISVYKDKNGIPFNVLEINGKIFAYLINVGNKEGYALLDVDGKKDIHGKQTFEEKYGYNEDFNIPEWVFD